METSKVLREKIKQKSEKLSEIVTIVNNKLDEWHRRRAWNETWILTDDVLALLDEAIKQIQDKKVNILEMFCYQGPPTRHWIETKGEFWKGWNEAIDKILIGLKGEK